MNGKKHGHGHLLKINDFEYDGEFKDDLYDGKGTLRIYLKEKKELSTCFEITSKLIEKNIKNQFKFILSQKKCQIRAQ